MQGGHVHARKSTADCVIVGAGVIGLSIAHHLAARGMTDIVVLEKESMAGGFRHQFSTEANIRLSQLSIEKLCRFEDELGQPIDFHQDGYLFLLNRAEDVRTFERNVELQRRLGVPVEWLATDDVSRVLPETNAPSAHRLFPGPHPLPLDWPKSKRRTSRVPLRSSSLAIDG